MSLPIADYALLGDCQSAALNPGDVFQDVDLPDHTGRNRRL